MCKEMFMAAHEELVEEYLEAHPNASWREAYDLTADAASDRMRDKFADIIDYQRLVAKEGRA
jgi:hypothetical protein